MSAHDLFVGLTAVVQYRTKNGAAPWRTMAAFDSIDMAENYAKDCTGAGDRPWEYRAAPTPIEPAPQATVAPKGGDA